MAPMKLTDHMTCLDVERREQRGRAVSFVTMRAPLDLTDGAGTTRVFSA
jgi:hypothetical protein